MNNNKQVRAKLKAAAAKSVDNFDPNMFVETRDVLALTADLDAAEKRIAELEAREVVLHKRSVGEVMHMSGFDRQYAEGWCAGNDNAIHEIHVAGISIKGE